jgi:pimeloyl-ACP methyl ester carboxylesterase
MKRLADVTIPRWFPPGSSVSPQEHKDNKRAQWVSSLITSTPVSGFEAGARALGSYDVLSLGVLESSVPNVLLLAGSLDGKGNVGAGLKQFGTEWNEKRKVQGRKEVEFVSVEGSGHLPMIDEPEEFSKAVEAFLAMI